MRVRRTLALAAIALGLVFGAAPKANAAAEKISIADSFRIGSGGVTCTAQNRSADPVLRSMFDRAWSITCQDAASPVGMLYLVNGAAAPEGAYGGALTCDPAEPADGRLTRAQCQSGKNGLRYVRYKFEGAGKVWFAEGLAGYESAVKLGMQSLLQNRALPGLVEVAATEAGDPTEFARIQAGSLDPYQALAEGYSRNNTGNFPAAAEFFDTLLDRSSRGRPGFERSAEYAGNRALQLSNLGSFAQADKMFALADRTADPNDPVQTGLLRNYRMFHALNQGNAAGALEAMNVRPARRAAVAADLARLEQGHLDMPVVTRLNTEDSKMQKLAGSGTRLSSTERVQLLDAQASYLKGAALRILGKADEAAAAQAEALKRVAAVREGRIASSVWLRASALMELASLAEAGNPGEAQKLMGEAVALYAANYPSTPALTAAKTRLAVSLARAGKADEARASFREAVGQSLVSGGAAANVRNYLPVYFDLLSSAQFGSDTGAASDFFAASQLLVRPGVAQTQAVFARELSGGSDEAARLFRQSLNISRDIVRLDADIVRMSDNPGEDPQVKAALQAVQQQREELAQQQTGLLSRLAEFPRFRAVSDKTVEIADLQRSLLPGETYVKLVIAGEQVYGLLVESGSARSWKMAVTATDLGNRVAELRRSVINQDSGQVEIEPFDVAASYRLFNDMFDPVRADLLQSKRLIFEPDGPFLILPVNLLATDAKAVDAYVRRIQDDDADAFDFRGIAWLGRDRPVTTSVSARGFIDIRNSRPSKAQRSFLGIGENAKPDPQQVSMYFEDACTWPLTTWQRPISGAELGYAAGQLAGGRPEVITGAAFSDMALSGRKDLGDFRILHFATHGLVSAPSPGCPARPALVTSFAGRGSDGLLSFREIFELRLDADLVVLSACDTAGAATVSATREAGVATGGNSALDGMVRAFVAAGARAIVASYWPLPDDYEATKTLVSGIYGSPSGVALDSSLLQSQRALMDRAETSHPVYWSGFAIVGDGTKSIMKSASK